MTSPSAVTKLERENVTLTCQYEGKPMSTVEWFKDGTKIVHKSNSRFTVIENGNPNSAISSLTISNLHRTDEGKYKCVANNSIQASSTEAQLTVNYAAEGVKIEPGEGVDQNGSVDVFSNFILVCKGGGKPLPSFTWKKNDKGISEPEITGDHKEILTVKNAQRDDGGTYTCSGHNKIGDPKRSSNSMEIKINESTTFITIPLYIVSHTSSGDLVCYSIVIAHKGSGPAPSIETLEKTLENNPDSTYITMMVGINDSEATVGDGKYYPLPGFKDPCKKKTRRRRDAKSDAEGRSPNGIAYQNKLLEPGTPYRFIQKAETSTKGKFEYFAWTPVITTKEKPKPSSAVLGVVLGVRAAVIVICVGVLIVNIMNLEKYIL